MIVERLIRPAFIRLTRLLAKAPQSYKELSVNGKTSTKTVFEYVHFCEGAVIEKTLVKVQGRYKTKYTLTKAGRFILQKILEANAAAESVFKAHAKEIKQPSVSKNDPIKNIFPK